MECSRLRIGAFYQAHKEKVKARVRAYRIANPEKVKAREATYRNARKDRAYHNLINVLRSRVRSALKGKTKSAAPLELLGCSVEFLWEELLRRCEGTEMTWGNYGKVWHLDHVRTLASFDLSDPAQQREAFAWTNLRPLLATSGLAPF